MSEFVEEEECPPGSPPWMSTFADLATLLMAFFVLIVSQTRVADPDDWDKLGNIFQESIGLFAEEGGEELPQGDMLDTINFRNQATEQAFVVKEKTTAEVPKEIELAVSELAGQFDTYADLEILKDTLATAVAAGKVELKSMDGKLVVTVKGEADDDGTSDSDETMDEGEIDSETLELYAKIAEVQAEIETEVVVEHLDLDRQELARDEGYEQRITEQFEALKINLKQEVDAGLAKIEMIEKKIVIKLASQDSFESGFATLRSSFLPTLGRVRDAVSGTPERITVSGHTDNVPIMFSDRFRSNWDLSSARASAVADFMLQDPNVLQSRLRVYGFADTRPATTNDTREGRAENRRIEIEIGQ
jgi:chemotaxis protein MotB